MRAVKIANDLPLLPAHASRWPRESPRLSPQPDCRDRPWLLPLHFETRPVEPRRHARIVAYLRYSSRSETGHECKRLPRPADVGLAKEGASLVHRRVRSGEEQQLMKRMLNEAAAFREEMIAGYASAYGRYLQRVPGASGVMANGTPASGKVSVVVGGGSGHYPAFYGLVGQGLASGA